MKKIYSLLCCAATILASAQSAPANQNNSLDAQLSNINQTTVTSGIIYERVMKLANIYNFNQTTTFNTANFDYFKQAFSEMNRASNSTKFISINDFLNVIAPTTNANTVDLALLTTQYNILNYDVLNEQNGGLTFNETTNKFSSIAGKVPFYLLHNTIIAPTKNYLVGNTAIFNLRNDLFFKNGTKTIETLVANFGDGINRTLITGGALTNQSITVNYTTSGEKK